MSIIRATTRTSLESSAPAPSRTTTSSSLCDRGGYGVKRSSTVAPSRAIREPFASGRSEAPSLKNTDAGCSGVAHAPRISASTSPNSAALILALPCASRGVKTWLSGRSPAPVRASWAAVFFSMATGTTGRILLADTVIRTATSR